MTVPSSSVLLMRLATPDDIPAISALEQVAQPHPWSAPMLAAELENPRSTLLLAFPSPDGDEASTLAGYIVFWLVADELHVLNVATAPAFRRRGVASALLHEAESRARAGSAVLSTLEVRVTNEPARRLYSGRGYEQVALRRKYYQDNNEDGLVMVKVFGAD